MGFMQFDLDAVLVVVLFSATSETPLLWLEVF